MVASLLASANILHFYQKNLNKTTQKKIRGKKKEAWPVSMFPETKKETRGSPALFVSGNFQGNQRVFVSAPSLVLHSGNSLFSLSLRARLGQNLRRNRGNLENTRVFPGIPAKYPGILPIWLILGPNQLISTEFPRGKLERKREGAVEKHGKETRRGARGNMDTA